ncbi:uncharacterized protein GGS22DRAFT_190335 [Annulohypoxylon maeteangense]|uniref:uncharacterized protein n=1 Tax=Annulohypoxylon maeteangense TaxID=1927788 RepID=UPI00200824E7|nr:uncharacterized protein GGS22DRAFT_190335 [Annulohypoxylon maeteangense]KAI0883030.1 hypothetical protein GGS22DRAFT_190335 [Annulohypoxylon maeteangense]
MPPKSRALLTGDEIALYDPGIRRSKSRTWREFKLETWPSWLVVETIRCTEMGVIPPEVMAALTQHDCWFYLDRDIHMNERLGLVYDEAAKPVPVIRLNEPANQLTITKDLDHWDRHGRRPARGLEAGEGVDGDRDGVADLRAQLQLREGELEALRQDPDRDRAVPSDHEPTRALEREIEQLNGALRDMDVQLRLQQDDAARFKLASYTAILLTFVATVSFPHLKDLAANHAFLATLRFCAHAKQTMLKSIGAPVWDDGSTNTPTERTRVRPRRSRVVGEEEIPPSLCLGDRTRLTDTREDEHVEKRSYVKW